ncbi:hypothetical protein Aph01nite_48920 [Acrocarpospora phusangensis]|uniref:Uncharacterized protein n=1 Tax=Acrocarpospora phusangensis TaxID=1070424 RepID=A0A919UQ87_9ACTN|nr:hypothetical protein [Acrocarpospora phusangensis]GIH26582.1 hypothetical protein Aph01nite_48920 [Acrocarpospora phusangensis]
MAEVLRPASTATSAIDRRDAVAAPVRDPMWLLARQWQTGGFTADDAGSPVAVALAAATAPLTGPDGLAPVPLEAWIEAEPPPALDDLDARRLAALATELVRRLRDEGVVAAREALTTAFPFTPDTPGERIRPFAARVPDPRTLRAALLPELGEHGDGQGSLPPIQGLAAELTPGVEKACRSWLAWIAGQVAPVTGPAATQPAAWDPQRLEYRFGLSARLPAASVDLRADEYDGTGVEWHTFDRAAFDPATGTGTTPLPTLVRPTPVTYPGMPRARFWEFEDGAVNLDTLTATDPAHAVLVTFAHRYANDWFVIPLTVPPGACTIETLVVTDNFGGATPVSAVAAVDRGSGPFRLWELSSQDDDPEPGAGLRMFVPPTPKRLHGEPIEDVLLLRDELANLAWLVERTTRDRDGEPVDRYRRHLTLRPPQDPSFHPAQAATGAPAYRLGTPVPDYWYPLVATTGADGRPLLALAGLPDGAAGVSDAGVQGHLVPHDSDTVIADEEVPREGVRLILEDRLTTGGADVILWRARAKLAGSGEGSSGLRFDVLLTGP